MGVFFVLGYGGDFSNKVYYVLVELFLLWGTVSSYLLIGIF